MGLIKGIRGSVVACVLALNLNANAEGLTGLPTGVWSPMIGYTVLSGLDEVFQEDGTLRTLTEDTSVVLDAETLIDMEPEAKKAIDFINNTGTNNIGDMLHLGVIEIDAKPSVSYYTPILAYGVNRRLTIGFGFPVINYENQVQIRHYGSNVDSFVQAYGAVDELREGFDEMKEISGKFRKTIADKGYKPLTNRSDSFTGDTIVNIQYIVWGNRRTRLLSKTSVNLPTGPAYDPDDLMALNLFGRTHIDQNFVLGRRLSRRFTIAGKAGFRFPIKDQIERRVPTSDGDLLPGAETKETVERQTGITTRLGVFPSFDITSTISASYGLEFNSKQPDRYSGSKGTRYDLLEKDTDSEWTVSQIGFSYSSVDAFMKEQAMLPAIISYTYSDTVAGRNTQRETSHELLFTLFYK